MDNDIHARGKIGVGAGKPVADRRAGMDRDIAPELALARSNLHEAEMFGWLEAVAGSGR